MNDIQVSMHAPAFLESGPVLVATNTGSRVILRLRDDAVFEARTSRHQLEYRGRRVNARNRSVVERTQRIKSHMRPALVAFAAFQRKDVRVQTWRRNHRQNFTIAGINRNQGSPCCIGNRCFGHLLQFQINRRYHMKPGLGLYQRSDIRKRTHFAPRSIDLDELESVRPAKFLVVFLFQSLLPDAVPLRIRGVLREFQLFFRNFARVAQHVRSKRPIRVFSAGFDNHGDTRQFRRMFFNHRHLFHRRIFQNANRTSLHPANPLERRIERKRIKKARSRRIPDIEESPEDGIPIGLFLGHFERLEGYLVRRAVPHQHIPVPVVNVAAVRNQLYSTQAVILGALEVLFVMDVLQRKKLEQNHQKKNERPGQKNQDIPVPADTSLIFRRIVIHSTSSPRRGRIKYLR